MVDIKQGDCLELIKDIPDSTIDLVLTDPPPTTSENLPRNVASATVL